jgi:RNA polymerase sigma-70 factor (ECF subfamily)
LQAGDDAVAASEECSQGSPDGAAPPRDARSDAQLLAAIAHERDARAFAELFQRYAPKLTAHFARSSRDPARVDDLVQDVMLSVWSHAASYRAELAAPSTWVFRIARNRHIDLHRRQRVFEVEPDASLADPAAPTLDDDVGLRRFGERMLAELAELPAEQAEVVRGSYFGHETASELSARLNVPLGTVKSRLRAALAALRTRLGLGGEP